MFLYVCLLVLLVPVTPLPVSTEATPGPSHESGPSSQAPVHAAAEFQDKTQGSVHIIKREEVTEPVETTDITVITAAAEPEDTEPTAEAEVVATDPTAKAEVVATDPTAEAEVVATDQTAGAEAVTTSTTAAETSESESVDTEEETSPTQTTSSPESEVPTLPAATSGNIQLPTTAGSQVIATYQVNVHIVANGEPQGGIGQGAPPTAAPSILVPRMTTKSQTAAPTTQVETAITTAIRTQAVSGNTTQSLVDGTTTVTAVIQTVGVSETQSNTTTQETVEANESSATVKTPIVSDASHEPSGSTTGASTSPNVISGGSSTQAPEAPATQNQSLVDSVAPNGTSTVTVKDALSGSVSEATSQPEESGTSVSDATLPGSPDTSSVTSVLDTTLTMSTDSSTVTSVETDTSGTSASPNTTQTLNVTTHKMTRKKGLKAKAKSNLHQKGKKKGPRAKKKKGGGKWKQKQKQKLHSTTPISTPTSVSDVATSQTSTRVTSEGTITTETASNFSETSGNTESSTQTSTSEIIKEKETTLTTVTVTESISTVTSGLTLTTIFYRSTVPNKKASEKWRNKGTTPRQISDNQLTTTETPQDKLVPGNINASFKGDRKLPSEAEESDNLLKEPAGTGMSWTTSSPIENGDAHGGSPTNDLEIGTKTGGDSSKVTVEAGHYKVTVDQEILDLITDFFNKLDSNEDDVLDSSELADEWEQLDVDGDGVLSSEEIHGKLTWFELYAFDVDGDGIATNREFERATKSLDIDGNGKVEFNEFIVKTGMIRNQNKDSHNTYRR